MSCEILRVWRVRQVSSGDLAPYTAGKTSLFRAWQLMNEMRARHTQTPSRHPAAPAERDLIQRCLEGDHSAWDALVRAHWKRVFKLAYRFAARYDEAEDLTQEIFVKLFRSLATYDRQASFETWLTRITRNLCIDHYRRRRREAQKVVDDIDLDTVSFDQLLSSPDAALAHRDEISMVRRALAQLPAAYKAPVTLRDIRGLSYEEIAAQLQLPEGTVKSRINRGRRELAKHLRVLQGHQSEMSNAKRC